MYKIVASTLLIVSSGFDDNDQFIPTSEEFLRKISGFIYDPDYGKIAEFIEFEGPDLTQDGPSITLRFNSDKKLLEALSSFISLTELNESQLESFKREYDGQMSDGMGSNMTQELSDEYEPEFEVYWLYDASNESEIVQSKVIP